MKAKTANPKKSIHNAFYFLFFEGLRQLETPDFEHFEASGQLHPAYASLSGAQVNRIMNNLTA